MRGKVCLITGATACLGAATAQALAGLGATVVLGCRDRGRGEAARAAIVAATDNQAIEVLLLDLARQASVREAIAAFRARHDRLDVLINNAAVYARGRVVTPDGLEAMFATNHLGHFLLTTLLLDTLRASASARIITLTAPSTTKLDFADLQGARRFSAFTAFGASKMCNLLFTYELARRLAGSGVTANAVHPGLVRSNILNDAPAPVRWVSHLFSAMPEKAARAVVRVASADEYAGTSGQFLKEGKPITPDAYARNPVNQQRLWEESAALVQPTPAA
jgi:retinol dehydrogenase-12